MSLFSFGKKKESNYNSKDDASTANMQNVSIKVLGGGCAKCHELQANAVQALDDLGIHSEVELITDFGVIATYGVMSTPALVLNEKVVSSGKVLKMDEIKEMIRKD